MDRDGAAAMQERRKVFPCLGTFPDSGHAEKLIKPRSILCPDTAKYAFFKLLDVSDKFGTRNGRIPSRFEKITFLSRPLQTVVRNQGIFFLWENECPGMNNKAKITKNSGNGDKIQAHIVSKIQS